jgi:membrane protease YdiL (CAAX protease family)
LARLQAPFEWNFLFHIWFFVIPLSALGMGLGSLQTYGLCFSLTPRNVGIGLAVFLPFVLFPLVGEALFAQVRLQPRLVGHVAETLLFQFLFVAVGEELFYTGFIQGTLNDVYGRPLRWGETSYGAGAIATAVLLGIGHLLNPFKPHLGIYTLDWGAFVWTASTGFLSCLARERSGNLLVPILAHAGINAYLTLFVMDLPGRIGFFAAACVTMPLLAAWAAGPESTPCEKCEQPQAPSVSSSD